MIEAPKKRNPKIMIYDIDAERAEQETIEDIYIQNVEDQISKDEFIKEFKCVHKYPNKNRGDKKANWVVECSARVRNLRRRRARLYVGWQSCRSKDYNPVARCYKCIFTALGHMILANKLKNTTLMVSMRSENDVITTPHDIYEYILRGLLLDDNIQNDNEENTVIREAVTQLQAVQKVQDVPVESPCLLYTSRCV